jgi:hypothetical protein
MFEDEEKITVGEIEDMSSDIKDRFYWMWFFGLIIAFSICLWGLWWCCVNDSLFGAILIGWTNLYLAKLILIMKRMEDN